MAEIRKDIAASRCGDSIGGGATNPANVQAPKPWDMRLYGHDGWGIGIKRGAARI